MKHLKCAAAALALLLLASCGRTAPPPAPAAQRFGDDPLWDDGRFEVSTYVGSTERGGEERPTVARLVVMAGRLTPAGTQDTTRTLSFDFVVGIPADAGRETTAAVLRRDSLDPIEVRVSRSERCGLTRVHLGRDAGRFVQTVASCLAEAPPGRTAVTWPADGRPQVCWDALPVWLRGLAGETAGRKPPFEVRVWLLPGQLSGRSPLERARPLDAVVRVTEADSIDVPAGRFAALEIAVAAEGKADAYWLDAKYPHALLKMQTAAHRTLGLTRTARVAAAAPADPTGGAPAR